MKGHLLWGALVVLALVALVVMERRAGAALERAARLQDSLTTVGARLDSLTSTALAHVARDTALERQRLAAIRARDAQLATDRKRLDSLERDLRATVGIPALQARLDSLSAFHARREGILADQRDSALILFRGAAAQRDTLAALLAESQAQRRSLMTALIEARKQPLWDKPVARVVEVVGAFLLGKL